MSKRMMASVVAALLVWVGHPTPSAQAFDLEDYATTFRATRDAYLKAKNELSLAAGVYARARIVMDLMGFDMSAEALFWPLDNYRPKIADRTGQACDWEGQCNATATCSGGICTAPTVRHPIVGLSRSEWQNLRKLHTRAAEVGDQIDPTDFWMGPNGSEDLWYRQATDGSGEGVALQFEKNNAINRLAWEINRVPMRDEAAEDAGPYAGYIVPLHFETAPWPVDPVEDWALIENAWYQYMAIRNAFLKAAAEAELARSPYEAALAAYVVATERYTALISCGDMMPELPAEWFCAARGDAGEPLRCACNLGPGRCDASDPAVVVNEAAPTASYRVCPEAPEPGLHCACVLDTQARPCAPGATTRYYN
jgi:hypothetical protein